MMNSKQYNRYVARLSPKSKVWKNTCFAFLIGGAICTLGQLLLVAFSAVGLDKDAAGTATSCALVFLSALTTGLSWYDDLAKLGGAGTLVPITGFANAVAAPAIEFKTDVRCIIRIVRETRNRRVSGLNPTYFYWEGGT